MDVERRPHWDDELLKAVYDAVFQCVDRDSGGVYEDVLPDVIAAVEDWHKAKRDSRDRTHSDECWRWHQECGRRQR